MPAGEKEPTDDVVVIDLEAHDHHDTEHPDSTSIPDDGRSPHRLRTGGFALAGIGVLLLGVFVGHTAAGNAADNEVRVFAGDITVGSFSNAGGSWEGSLPVLNDGTKPVEVVDVELPGFSVSMIDDAVSVPATGRSTLNLSIAAQCADEVHQVADTAPLTLTVTAAGADHTVDTPTKLAPHGVADVVANQCRPTAPGSAVAATLDVRAHPEASGQTLTGSVGVRVESSNSNDEIQVTGIRSSIPGLAVDAHDLPQTVGAAPTFVDITWTVSDCARATAIPNRPLGASIGATIRSQGDDGTVTDTAVTDTIPTEVAVQLGVLAASSCST